jgi:transposase
LSAALDTLGFLQEELRAKGTSIERLRRLIFGVKTEKTSGVLGTPHGVRGDGERPKPVGHGRNGAAAYAGAERVKVTHPSLNQGDACGCCEKGRVYPLAEPATLVRVTGMAPLGATVFEKERWRCNLCGEVFTAPSPEGVGEEKYDETATAMVGLLKYGTGLPFNRIEKLQQGMGIPMPAATQWEIVKDGAEKLAPVHDEMVLQAAQAKVLHNDDTTMKVLELSAERRASAAADEQTDGRTGVFTSGIVSVNKEQLLALFFTGAQHAGENLAEVLAQRASKLNKPIQMCDALPSNTAGDFDSLLASCISHARRRYVDVAEDFPDECRYVLETLRSVYKNDAEARSEGLTDARRLVLHKAKSAPLMQDLERWMREQLEEHRVEENSGLGQAIRYMQKHWSKLTLFLRKPGAPLDNNICERALKKAILHRKNALFYRTLSGAHVGDVYMSFIHSAELNGAEPFHYLVALLRHHRDAERAPARWMPWNYRETLNHLVQTGPPR